MGIPVSRLFASLLLVCSFVANAADAPKSASDLELERAAAFKAVQESQKPGPADIALRDQAHLKLPEGYVWVPQPAAGQMMEVMGNRVDSSFVGAVLPNSDSDWFAIVKFVDEGYIKDDDAKDWNADDMLKSLREGTEAFNAERAKRGITPIEVTGWAQKPQYDAATHRLVWSALSKEKGGSADDQGVNYNTYSLGRDGYISLNLVTNANQLDKFKPDALKLLAALEYNDGKRYADFNGSTDKVAAYGLAALVAGAAAKKLGLLAVVLAFLAKFAKIIVVAVGGVLWGITKVFKKKSPAPVAASTSNIDLAPNAAQGEPRETPQRPPTA